MKSVNNLGTIEKILNPTNKELAIHFIENKSSKELKELLTYFVSKNVDINSFYDNYDDSLLHLAVAKTTTTKLKVLLSFNLNLEVLNLDDLTPLSLCFFGESNKLNHAKLLLSAGAKSNPKIFGTIYLLYHLAQNDNKHKAFKLLAKHYEQLNEEHSIYDFQTDSVINITLLNYAYKNNASKNYNFLLRYTQEAKEKSYLLKNIKTKKKVKLLNNNLKKI